MCVNQKKMISSDEADEMNREINSKDEMMQHIEKSDQRSGAGWWSTSKADNILYGQQVLRSLR